MGRGCCSGPVLGRPRGALVGPPHVPLPPHVLLALCPGQRPGLLGVAEHTVLFLTGEVHQLEGTKDGTDDEGEAMNFVISSVTPPPPPPPVRPTTPWHLRSTAPAWRSPKLMRARSIRCPCNCEMCPLCKSAYLLTFTTNSHKFVQNSYQIRAYKCLGQISQFRKFCGIRRNAYETRTKIRSYFCKFI